MLERMQRLEKRIENQELPRRKIVEHAKTDVSESSSEEESNDIIKDDDNEGIQKEEVDTSLKKDVDKHDLERSDDSDDSYESDEQEDDETNKNEEKSMEMGWHDDDQAPQNLEGDAGMTEHAFVGGSDAERPLHEERASGQHDGQDFRGCHNEPDVELEAVNSQKIASGLENVGSHGEKNKVCKYWLSGNCKKDEKCTFLHSWSLGDGISMLTKLEGHEKAITGIVHTVGSDKIYSGSTDGTTRIWDCHTGQCTSVLSHGDKVGSLICEGSWILIGLPNTVKGMNVQTSAEFSLKGPVGQVNAMVVENHMLFAGAQNGVISVWKGGSEANPFNLVASMEGHSDAVVCLRAKGNMLFSGSIDHTIRVWDLNTLTCVATLNDHTDVVMSLLCWSDYLISCSLDRTIKVWSVKEDGNWEVSFTHTEEHGLLSLSGMNDAESKAILFCSSNDNSVHLYDLPSFMKKGRLFSREEVRDIQTGPCGLFFTGDATGTVTVWNGSGWVGQ